MEYREHSPADAAAIERLFVEVFTTSEGEQEGALVGGLARDLIATTDERDLAGFVAVEGDEVVGAIVFSRLAFDVPIEAFLLSPVAVSSSRQGQGIGKRLITHGLNALQQRGTSLVMTYGDPAFYGKVGFQPVSSEVIPPPHKLSQPEGWLGQSLTGNSLVPLTGSCSCVKAMDRPEIW